ncbi:MAG TPA: hypothetical protein VNO82_18275 [Solirubrobacteraceae bacterium]|nr:hypothetical protein [Solirubrobacteraceae bacterium]
MLIGGQQLRDEHEQDDLPRRLGMRARPAARADGQDEERGEIAPHPA